MHLIRANTTYATHPPPSSLPQHQKPPQPIFPNQTRNTKHLVSFKTTKKPIDPVIHWTSSIARHCRNGQLAKAAGEFERMRLAGVEPNHITLLTLLSVCADSSPGILHFGASVHGHAHKLGFDTNNVMVGTAIVGMYAKSGSVELARLAFDKMGMRNLVSWNTMIDGYMRNGLVEDAYVLFDEMPERDAISWTALISGFLKKGYFEEALAMFREMQISGVEPDHVTIMSVLAACANLGAFGLGLWVNRFAMNKDFKDKVKISNTLIDMYSRCGYIEFAHQVFKRMPNRTLVSWNSLIVGFAVNGHAEEALRFFNLMQKEGFDPDEVSFTGVLTACSHAGLVDEALHYFDVMQRVHKISPRIEHYGCMVDLYSRSGRLEDALNVIKTMPMKPNEVILGSLLAAACRTNNADVGLAERLVAYLVELEPDVDSNYVLISNLYSASERWHGASEVRRKMKTLGIQKKPGLSSIEIDCSIHRFVSGDKSHVETVSIHDMLDLLSAELNMCGYVPETIPRELYEND